MKSLANVLLQYYIKTENRSVGIFEVIHQLTGASFQAISLLHCMAKFITQCISMVYVFYIPRGRIWPKMAMHYQ